MEAFAEFIRSWDGFRLVFIIGVIAAVLFGAHFRKSKIKKNCDANGLTLIADKNFKSAYIKTLGKEAAVFYEHENWWKRTPISVYEMASLNLRGKEAYIVNFQYSKGRSARWAQALIVESNTHMPYVKIAEKMPLFNSYLKSFYRPARQAEEIDIDKKYKLYCAQENAQDFLTKAHGILPHLQKDKLNVEISGNHIVVYKFGTTTDLAKFAAQTLPIADVFYAKNL